MVVIVGHSIGVVILGFSRVVGQSPYRSPLDPTFRNGQHPNSGRITTHIWYREICGLSCLHFASKMQNLVIQSAKIHQWGRPEDPSL